ncbi:Gfo/Idh/MocA family oxidoreductase [bacterium]|nr:Gfo/Idh/MocA family oxidoreductase [bacterium]
MSGNVRLGIIGLGVIGNHHANYLRAGDVKRCEFTAVCDIDPSRIEKFSDLKRFTSSEEMIRSGEVDAVLISTPHYSHTTIGIDALEQGLHVLVEKPISVHKADCERLLAAHKDPKQVFAVMFNLRTIGWWKKLKYLIDSGELGEIVRVNWTCTDWFRSEAYYANGGWRGTWSGEGGGVLMNQCPHYLDLWQYFFGMPESVRAFCRFGVRHNVEIEDEVTAYMEYANKATGVLITSTGEFPGTNRLEVAGEQGKVVIEGGKFSYTRNEVQTTQFSRTCPAGFVFPPIWNIDIPVKAGGQHSEITQNFVDAILDGTPLISPAEDGIRSVELANAMLYSTLTDSTVRLPLDSKAFEKELQRLIAESKFVKQSTKGEVVDAKASFH